MQRRILVSLVAGLTALGGVAVLPIATVSAGAGGSILVNTTDDGNDLAPGDGNCEITSGDGDCSLRAALDEAAGSDGMWEIGVPAGDYVLENGQLQYGGGIEAVVHGAGVGETTVLVDDEGLQRHLQLGVDGVTDLTLTDMTFRGGTAATSGGSILSEFGADLTIQRMHFVDNGVRGDGGAIAVYGGGLGRTLVIEDSTFTGNNASESGGAVQVSDGESATITNSTFTDNHAQYGGALFVGELDNPSPGEATLTHVTMAGNTADIGAQGEPAAGGAIGVGSGGEVEVIASIIENSTEDTPSLPFAVPAALPGGPAANCYVGQGGSLVSGGFNVVDDETCEASESTDQEDTAADVQALADNGGPTSTMALLAASPAVDAAGATCSVSDDQRGVARPQRGGCDSGAFELAAAPAVPVPGILPTFTG